MNKFDKLCESILTEKKTDWSAYKDKWINRELIDATLNSVEDYKSYLESEGLTKETKKRLIALALGEITALKNKPSLAPSVNKKLEDKLTDNFYKLYMILGTGRDPKTGFAWGKGKTVIQTSQFFKYLLKTWGI